MMGKLERITGASVPMPAVSRILARYDRVKVEAFIEIAIGLLDTFDGPEDADSPDFTPRADGQPGTPDEGEVNEDEEAGAYAEWGSLNPRQRQAGACVIESCRHEDDEQGADETDGNMSEDENCAYFARMKSGPGCVISDSDVGDADTGAV